MGEFVKFQYRFLDAKHQNVPISISQENMELVSDCLAADDDTWILYLKPLDSPVEEAEIVEPNPPKPHFNIGILPRDLALLLDYSMVYSIFGKMNCLALFLNHILGVPEHSMIAPEKLQRFYRMFGMQPQSAVQKVSLSIRG